MALAAAWLTLCVGAPALWPSAPLAARAAEHAPRRRGDFLAILHRKPAHLRYIGCRSLPDQQGKPLRATYRVAGRHAAETERFLVQALGMPRLRRSCCQWDAPRHAFRGADGESYDLTMVSDETAVGSRAAWDRIPVFEIIVETFTEEI